MQVPTIGRIVHYHPEPIDGFMEDRPAIIVRVWTPGAETSAVQLQVFTDALNDGPQNSPGILWKTSRLQGDGPGQFSFPQIPGR